MIPAARLLAVLSLALLGCAEKPWNGIVIDPPAAAPPLTATAADGSNATLAAEKGAVVLLYFGYTHCPDVCPTTMSDWAQARRALGADTSGVRFIFVAVDPPRDTPAIADAYAKEFDATFTGIATSETQLPLMLRDWGIAAFAEGDPRTPDYGVTHPAHTYVVDREGKLRLMIPPGTRGDVIAGDLRRLR